MRERGSDTQQSDPGRESNPGPLQRGQSLGTWDAALPTELKAPGFYHISYAMLVVSWVVHHLDSD